MLTTHEPATIDVDISAHTPLQDTVVVVRIDSLTGGSSVWETSTRRNGRTIGLIDGPASVKIAIPSLPLLEGVYDLTVGLMDSTEVHPYDFWERRVRFEVSAVQVVRHTVSSASPPNGPSPAQGVSSRADRTSA